MFSRAVEQYHAVNYEDALDYINQAIKANGRIAGYYELKGDIQTKQGKLKAAIVDYDKAKSLRSFYPEVFLKSAKNYFRLQEYDHAIRNYKKAFVQEPQQISILLNLAECNLQLTELNLAMNILKEYIMHCEKQSKLAERFYYVLFAKIKFEQELFEDVISSMVLARQNGPLNRNEGLFYVRALIQENELENAYRLATIDLKNELKAAEIHFIRGLYYYHLNNFKDAKNQLELSIANNTIVFEAYETLSNIYKQENDFDRAQEVLKQGEKYRSFRFINYGLSYK
ncbi:MAG: tetratricopeptide repeat protein [Calditrichaeota bacterium]|nr:tetratricopeptide repeat protein [Calditrichota bacterium]